jgi:hypothetical protein
MKEPTRLYAAFSGIFLLLHSIFHSITGVIALIVLFRGELRGTFWFALLFGAFYFGLAIFGIVVGHATILGLQPFDHPFHLALGGLGFLAVGIALYQSQKEKQASGCHISSLG